MEARTLASLYVWRKEKEASSGRPAPRKIKGRREELRQVHVVKWANRLNNPSAGLALIEAVRPIMSEWLNRRHGTLTFRLTQVLSGHGCFGKYLYRIRREQTSGCHHCVGGEEDTVLHTLQVCPAWDEQRCDLIAAIGADLSLPALVKAMVGSADAWNAARISPGKKKGNLGCRANGALNSFMDSQKVLVQARLAVHNGVLVPTLMYDSES
ncbi:hypothetical protein K1T71_004032 [Dendrolimus kikuchii]|uniref:Uncharacterized protein n=1 Tax=Dendrolimus kikuchii TaxID=765133 RepID=A0ACC1DAK4_9NEOP|nr:hypothetical protein K1T71_004032 [Dendrolimus kikuchii]